MTVPGAAAPFPYGGKVRQIQVDLDLPRLQAYGLQPTDIVNAVNAQNLVLPSGTVKLGQLEYPMEMNGTPPTIAALNGLPVRTTQGSTLYIRDVAHVRDGFSPQTNIVRADGTRGALMSVYKNGKASTLEIVAGVKGILAQAVFVSIILLGAIGQTINIMTLGGLALAVGILVDDATAEIENIERNLAMGKEMRQAILDGAQQIAVPAFVSTLCICIVFVPMFFLSGVAKFLFVPLAEAVSFAMLASYVLSRTLIPTLVMYIMRGHEHRAQAARTFLGRFQREFERRFEAFRAGCCPALSARCGSRSAPGWTSSPSR